MYLKDVNEVIKEKAGDFVALLKKTDCYSIVSKKGSVEEAADIEETDSVEEAYTNNDEE